MSGEWAAHALYRKATAKMLQLTKFLNSSIFSIFFSGIFFCVFFPINLLLLPGFIISSVSRRLCFSFLSGSWGSRLLLTLPRGNFQIGIPKTSQS